MHTKLFRSAACAALAGCALLAAEPALAAVETARAPQITAAAAPTAGYGDDWGDDRGRGWGRGRGWRRDDGISAGDVLAGVLVIGAIAAIASAASKADKAGDRADDSADYNDAPPPPGDTAGSVSDWSKGQALDRAVDACANAIDQGEAKVDTVDQADGYGDGFRVSGKTAAGKPWACETDRAGKIRDLSVDGFAY